MSLTYGYDLNDVDEFMEAPAQAIELMSPLFLPGAVLVNYLPFCTVPYFITPMLASHSFFSTTHSFMGSVYQLRTTYSKRQEAERDNKEWTDRLCEECYGLL